MPSLELVSSAAIALAAGSSHAGDLLWDNVPDGFTTETVLASQLDTAYPFDAQVADDFVLDGGGEITAVTFWGGFFSGSPVPIGSFNILFYDDDGGAPPGGPGDPTGLATAAFSVSAVATPDGGGFRYEADLGGAFTADPASIYWIAIQAVFEFPPQWGLSISNTIQGSETYGGFPEVGVEYWTPGSDPDYMGFAADAAFQLYGIPAPGTLAIVGLAGWIRRSRRRDAHR